MGEMVEYFRDVKEARSQHKRERYAANEPFIEWLMYIAKWHRPLPGGIRIAIVGKFGYEEVFDYWPSSGKWFELKPHKYRQGERMLRNRLNEVRGYYD